MTYNNPYYPAVGYQPVPNMYSNQIPTSAPVSPQVQNNGSSIIWVQGEAGAKAYPVTAGSSVLLMDSEESVMYIKSTDQSGMPQPLRIFDYTERKTDHSEASAAKTIPSDYVSRDEFDEFKEDVKRTIKGIRKPRMEDDE